MLRIAVCDDNKKDLANTTTLLNEFAEAKLSQLQLKVTAFQSALDLIAALDSGQPYDLVLLDILMPHMTGMDAAKEIRQFNQDIKIIFATSSPEYAVESYSVDAYYYALKPLQRDSLFIILDKVIADMTTPPATSFLVRSKTGLSRVYINRLEFVEVIGRTLLYHLTDGSLLKAISSMTELEKELLQYPCFIKPHRSYIINMDFINNLGVREIIMQSRSLIPLSKANTNPVKDAYISYIFKN